MVLPLPKMKGRAEKRNWVVPYHKMGGQGNFTIFVSIVHG
jgi:hypothetical protein